MIRVINTVPCAHRKIEEGNNMAARYSKAVVRDREQDYMNCLNQLIANKEMLVRLYIEATQVMMCTYKKCMKQLFK